MFKYSNSVLALAFRFACGADAFQTPKPSKTQASLDASYIERTLEWPDLFEIPPEGDDKDPLVAYKNQASVAVAPPTRTSPSI